MTDDIVTRLRNRRGTAPALCDAAADEIELLRQALIHCRWHDHPIGECELCDLYQKTVKWARGD